MSFKVPEKYRVTIGQFRTTQEQHGNNGAFFIPTRPGRDPLRVIASDMGGWEHVSVSLPDQCPSWELMCKVKSLFWDDEDCVMQLHPPRSQWVNNHSFCLHLWRPTDGRIIPTPPQLMVGIPEIGTLV